MPNSDRVLLKTRHPWVVYVPPLLLLAAGLWMRLSYVEELQQGSGIALVIAGVVWFLRRVLVSTTNRLTLTSTTLTARTGVLSASTLDIALGAVESIKAHTGVFGRLLGYGTVSVRGGGGSQTDVYLVASPERFRVEAMTIVAGSGKQGYTPSDDQKQSFSQDSQWHQGLLAQPFEVQIPYPPKVVMEALKSRSGDGGHIKWHVSPGARIAQGTLLGNFQIDWQGLHTRRIMKQARERVMGAGFAMPIDGIVKFMSRSETDPYLFAVQPLLKEGDPFESHHSHWTQEDYQRTFAADPHSVHFALCEAAYVIIQRTSGLEEEKVDALINAGYKALKSRVVLISG